MVFEQLFPNGVWHYLLGGVLLGLGIGVIYVFTGIIQGASSFLESSLSWISRLPVFQGYSSSRKRRLVFVVSIIAGSLLFTLSVAGESWRTDVQWWRLLFGGFFIGFGSRLGGGCTSGHGVCGIASLSKTSMINVLTFISVAIGVALIVQSFGVIP